MYIDLEKNAQYYSSDQTAPCDCGICKLYCAKVKTEYPKVAEYLSSINVDILKPLELIWFEDDDNDRIEYVGCQYIVFGKCDAGFKKKIGDVLFEINVKHHPSTERIKEEHFVLDFGTIYLKSK